MRIENTVEVDAPLDRVWALVNDIPRVAPCMPGAALTGVGDDNTYEGTVAVKLGPLRMSYKGKVVVEDVDEASHSARLAASGRDTKGAGTARANVETRLEPVDPTRTRLHVTSDVQLTGKVASFGRGGAINDVAARLFGQFADCLRATLESEPAAAATAVPGGGGTAAPAAGDGSATPPAAGNGAAAAAAGSTGTAAGTATPSPAAPTGGGGTAAEAPPSATTPGATGTSATPTGTETAPSTGSGAAPPTGAGTTPPSGTGTAPPTGTGATASTGDSPAPTSGTGAAGDGTTTAGAGATTGGTAATPVGDVPPSSPRAPAPQPVEALDAGSLVGTVIKGRLRALFQAIAGFFRRLFGGRRTG
jgi:uncharacterized protein